MKKEVRRCEWEQGFLERDDNFAYMVKSCFSILIVLFCSLSFGQTSSGSQTLNIRFTDKKAWVELNGKTLKGKYSLRKLKSILGEPDSIVFHKKHFHRCQGLNGHCGTGRWSPKHVNVFYTRLGIVFYGKRSSQLNECIFRLDSLDSYPSRKKSLAFNGISLAGDIPILNTKRIIQLAPKEKLSIKDVFINFHPEPLMNWNTRPSFGVGFYGPNTSVRIPNYCLLMSFDENSNLRFIHVAPSISRMRL